MRFTKPHWVMHQDGNRTENPKPVSIFSVSVHPDGSRIATGGLDAKVRIWSTKPILNQTSELSNRPPKALCTLNLHTGPVLTVRWAHSGRWLASGSDDTIVMIWDLDPAGGGKIWGSDEYNIEGWKPLKRLPGHESDVTDLSWSPDDRYLASVGLDSKVIIWCGFTLERLTKLDLHQGFVKGVCWDPAGEFLATQSDDRTVRIWRTADWGLEATVDKPFDKSPGSTFFRRLSWSPDGAHITASNAMSSNGLVFVAAVINRNTWTSEISLVGHENTVEVAAYNPHIFLRDPSLPVATANICSVVALGADDRSVSVWQTKSARPLIVAKEVFERQILDLSWSWDGFTLYAVSSDGTMGVFNFDKEELEGIAPVEAQHKYLQKFGFVPPPLPVGYSHDLSERENKPNGLSDNVTAPPTPPQEYARLPSSAGTLHNGFAAHSPIGEQVNNLIARKGPRGQKRVQSTFVGTLGSQSIPSAQKVSLDNRMSMQSTSNLSSVNVATASLLDDLTGNNIRLPPPPLQAFSRNTGTNRTNNTSKNSIVFDDAMDVDFGDSRKGEDMDVPISALDTRERGRRGTTSAIYGDDSKVPKARTLGGDRTIDPQDRVVREIRRGVTAPAGSLGVEGTQPLLEVPLLKTFMETKVGDSDDTFEARNMEDDSEPTEVAYMASKDKTVQWLDYLPSPAVKISATNRFCAVAMDDGSINIYSLTGRRLVPTIALGWPCSFFEGCKHYLMAITCNGQVHVWNTKTQSAEHPPVSLLPLLIPGPPVLSEPNAPRTLTISSASVRPNGAPLLRLSNGTTLAYDSNLCTWVRVSEPWWAEGSNCWKGRRVGNGGIVSEIEAHVEERRSLTGTSLDAEKLRPKWWTPALTLGHLESRMHAARVLESASEYRQALLLYSKTIADEGFRAKAEEVLKDLYGPVYWRPGRGDDSYTPTILGLSKRDLVKDVVQIFARSKTLYKLAQDYQDLLKKSIFDD